MSFTPTSVEFVAPFNAEVVFGRSLASRIIHRLIGAISRFARAMRVDRLLVNDRLLRDIGCSAEEAGRFGLELRHGFAGGQATSAALFHRPTAPLL